MRPQSTVRNHHDREILLFQFGDGSAPGSAGIQAEDSIRLKDDLYHAPMNASVLERAIAFTSDPHIKEIQSSVQNKQHRALGPTILDGVGIAILRTPRSTRTGRRGYSVWRHHAPPPSRPLGCATLRL